MGESALAVLAAHVDDVLAPPRVPERHVLSVERRVVQDGFVPHPPPVDPVGGRQRLQRLLAVDRLAHDGLVPLGRFRLGVAVQKRDQVRTGLHPDDAVVLGALELEDAQRRLRPSDPVHALGIGREVGVQRNLRLARLHQRLDLVAVVARAPVVHPVDAAVFDHRVVVAGAALPRSVGDDRRARGPGTVQLEVDTVSRIDQVTVDEKLTVASNVDGLATH